MLVIGSDHQGVPTRKLASEATKCFKLKQIVNNEARATRAHESNISSPHLEIEKLTKQFQSLRRPVHQDLIDKLRTFFNTQPSVKI